MLGCKLLSCLFAERGIASSVRGVGKDDIQGTWICILNGSGSELVSIPCCDELHTCIHRDVIDCLSWDMHK